jgi:ketosteroid isomerase-like protein
MREVAFAEGWTVADRVRANELLDELWLAGVQELRRRPPGGLDAYAPGFAVLRTEARLVAKPTLQGLEELVARLREFLGLASQDAEDRLSSQDESTRSPEGGSRARLAGSGRGTCPSADASPGRPSTSVASESAHDPAAVPRSDGRRMSGPAIELVRRAFERYREPDLDALMELLHPDVVAVVAVPSGGREAYRGRDEVLAMLLGRGGRYADYRSEARAFRTTPRGRVLVKEFVHYRLAERAQGAARLVYWLCEVRDDRILRLEFFSERSAALAAAGLQADHRTDFALSRA